MYIVLSGHLVSGAARGLRTVLFRRETNAVPKRNDIESILIIGAGPIVIGQACEFDYSGVQACKALSEEGFRVVLVNSNPATIMTDPDLADATYIEPVHWKVVARDHREGTPRCAAADDGWPDRAELLARPGA